MAKEQGAKRGDEDVMEALATCGLPGSLLLARVTERAALPSSLGYHDRVLLARNPLLASQLDRLYNGAASTLPVWDRLCADAAARSTLSASTATQTAAPPAGAPWARTAYAADNSKASGPASCRVRMRGTSGCVALCRVTMIPQRVHQYMRVRAPCLHAV